MSDKAPLAGRAVAIVHPAWHSCGTYQVVLGQIEAYRALGATITTVANNDMPGFAPTREWLWRSYVTQTPELNDTERFFAGAPLRRVMRPSFVRAALLPFLHGDQAAMRVGAANIAETSAALDGRRFDLVHCNHFFCMPVARRLARSAPVVLDTHDVQAKQFELINDARPILPPRARYEAMLARELAEMRDAAALLHLNSDEERFFRDLLPGAPHHLLYPPIPDVPTGPGGPDILLVSSWNTANLESMLWFLREVMPRAGDPPVRIAGNIDAGVKAKDTALHARYRENLLGRVDDLGALYARARLVLIPTIAGTGVSIKTIEALASGLPLLASPLAFRGMAFDPRAIPNVRIADSADAFALALRAVGTAKATSDAGERKGSATRQVYENTFSATAYGRRLANIVRPLLVAASH